MTDTLPPRTAPLPAQWNPGAVEAGMYDRWVEAGYFTADNTSDKPPYCISIPPPNVTGSLHLGHAMDHTLIDILCRRRRMQGYDVLWLPGMDHAGIATQSVVERRLADAGEPTRRELGREEFVRRVWRWKGESGGAILHQMRRLGDGVDWSRERFTLDEGLSRAVQTVFKQMFDAGLIYRAERLVNWSPALQSAISDIEVDHREIDGELVSMRYGSLAEGEDGIVVATTRVETMLGDTAVAVHPDDERYTHLVGREVELPLVGRRIPVIADDQVDPAFGTGAVKVTPAHDPHDFEMGRRHGLPMPTILDESGVVTGSGTRFDGMDRFAARVAIREALAAGGRIVAEKRPYRHSVGHDSRTGVVIEPRLSLQWFVKVEALAEAAGDAVRSGATRIHPPEMAARFFEWVDSMHDWCISRQLWWGHRIPVWYGPDGEVVCLGPDEDPPGAAGWTQDPDVLDTWFSSGLWPFSTLGWPDKTVDLERYYPTSVLVTGYDILFFWVVRMMMFGTHAMGEAPFADVYLHGLIRDEHGRKMSKSKGNVIDPLELLDEFGADALRFTIARGSNPGTDMSLSADWVAASRNFGTKLWNATRFALANGASPALPLPTAPTDADTWILGRLREVTEHVDALLEEFQFAKATEALYHFLWDEFCDWYLELAKPQLDAGHDHSDHSDHSDDSDDTAEGTRAVLGHVLGAFVRLLHPVSPFLTEALHQALTGEETVVTAAWPAGAGAPVDAAAAARIADLQELITEVRRFRTEQRVPDKRRVAARFVGLEEAGLGAHRPALAALVRLDPPDGAFTATATLQVALAHGLVTVELDTSGAIDVAAERARLGRDLAAAHKDLDQAEKKLGNPAFVAKAPVHVVEDIRGRQAKATADLERITARLSALPA